MYPHVKTFTEKKHLYDMDKLKYMGSMQDIYAHNHTVSLTMDLLRYQHASEEEKYK